MFACWYALSALERYEGQREKHFSSRWRNVSAVFLLVECEVALAPNGSKGLTSSCRDYTSQNKNVDAGGQDLDGERSHPAVCRFHKHFHAHHTSSIYARGQRRSRLNQKLNTNPPMRANQEQFSFYFDRVVKVEIIVLRAGRRRGAKSKECDGRSLLSFVL